MVTSSTRTGILLLAIAALLGQHGASAHAMQRDESPEVRVTVVDAQSGAPIPGAIVRIVHQIPEDEDDGSTPIPELRYSTTDESGRIVLRRDHPNRTPPSRRANASSRLYVDAPGYSPSIRSIKRTSSASFITETVHLNRGTRENWARDRTDELAARGHVWQSNLPQDNLTAYPVLRVRVLDMAGRPLEDALVTLAPERSNTAIEHRTGLYGTCVFSPYDFAYVTRFWQSGHRAILKGTSNAHTTTEEEQTVSVHASAHGYSRASIAVVLRTLDPAQHRVIRLSRTKAPDAPPSPQWDEQPLAPHLYGDWHTRSEFADFSLQQHASVEIRRPNSTARAVTAEIAHNGLVRPENPNGYGLWLTLYAFSDPFSGREERNYFDGAKHILLGRPRDGSAAIIEGKTYRIECDDVIIEYNMNPFVWHKPEKAGWTGHFTGRLHITAHMLTPTAN